MSNSANISLHEQLYLFKFCHSGLAPCHVPIHLIVVREENLGLVCNTPMVLHRTFRELEKPQVLHNWSTIYVLKLLVSVLSSIVLGFYIRICSKVP